MSKKAYIDSLTKEELLKQINLTLEDLVGEDVYNPDDYIKEPLSFGKGVALEDSPYNDPNFC